MSSHETGTPQDATAHFGPNRKAAWLETLVDPFLGIVASRREVAHAIKKSASLVSTNEKGQLTYTKTVLDKITDQEYNVIVTKTRFGNRVQVDIEDRGPVPWSRVPLRVRAEVARGVENRV